MRLASVSSAMFALVMVSAGVGAERLTLDGGVSLDSRDRCYVYALSDARVLCLPPRPPFAGTNPRWVDGFADPMARRCYTQVVVGSHFGIRAK